MLHKGESIQFKHGMEMLKHAFGLLLSWLQGRDYVIVAPEDFLEIRDD